MPLKKPSHPLVLNVRHPLTKGLVFDMPLFEGAGGRAIDLITKRYGRFTGTTAWVPQPRGKAIITGASGDSVTFATQPIQNNVHTISVETLFISFGSQTNGTRLFQKGDTGIQARRFWQHGEVDSGAMYFAGDWTGGQGAWNITEPSANVIHHLISTYDDAATTNDPVIYLNGVSQSVTEVLGPSGSRGTDDTQLWIANNNNVNVGWKGIIFYARYWNRILNLQDVQSLYRDPYQIYLPPPRRLFVFSSTLQTTTSTSTTTTTSTSTSTSTTSTSSSTSTTTSSSTSTSTTSTSSSTSTTSSTSTSTTTTSTSTSTTSTSSSTTTSTSSSTSTTTTSTSSSTTTSTSTSTTTLPASCTLDQQQAVEGGLELEFGTNAQQRAGQSFRPSQTGPICNVQIKIKKVGSPTDAVKFEIFSTSSGQPNVSLDEADDQPAGSGITTSFVKYDFNFTNGVSLTSGTTYAIVVTRTGSLDDSNYYVLGMGDSILGDEYANGSALLHNGTAWGNTTGDIYFKEYYDASGTTTSTSTSTTTSTSTSTTSTSTSTTTSTSTSTTTTSTSTSTTTSTSSSTSTTSTSTSSSTTTSTSTSTSTTSTSSSTTTSSSTSTSTTVSITTSTSTSTTTTSTSTTTSSSTSTSTSTSTTSTSTSTSTTTSTTTTSTSSSTSTSTTSTSSSTSTSTTTSSSTSTSTTSTSSSTSVTQSTSTSTSTSSSTSTTTTWPYIFSVSGVENDYSIDYK